MMMFGSAVERVCVSRQNAVPPALLLKIWQTFYREAGVGRSSDISGVERSYKVGWSFVQLVLWKFNSDHSRSSVGGQ